MAGVKPLYHENLHSHSMRPMTTFSEIIAEKGTPEMLAKRLPLTKIVATIGPASEHLTMLTHVVKAGMRVMRINFSHATYEEADLRMRNLNKCFGINHPEGISGNNFANMRAVMLDTQGPEIRLGMFKDGIKGLDFHKGDKVTLTTNMDEREHQTIKRLWVSYPELSTTVLPGSKVLLDDGAVELIVDTVGHKQASDGSAEVLCTVQNPGFIGNRKGVNLPGLAVLLPPMCEKDKSDILWGIKNNVDMIAASFVRKASDVIEIREFTRDLMNQVHGSAPTTSSLGRDSSPVDAFPLSKPLPLIISKIESVEALQNFDEILSVSDGIMVARGDLAVEIPMETLANVQKEIVKRCNTVGKPVIVATQMLESMQKNPRPTRAECTDVANALMDGADCVMLSGESAKGRYPAESVALMKRIVDQTELSIHETDALEPRPVPDLGRLDEDIEQAVAYAAVQFAHSLRHDPNFSCIVVTMSSAVQKSIQLAKYVSKFRPQVPIVCIVPNHKTGKQLQIFRGLHPVLMLPETDRHDDNQVLQHLKKLGMVKPRSKVLLLHQHSATSHEIAMNVRTA